MGSNHFEKKYQKVPIKIGVSIAIANGFVFLINKIISGGAFGFRRGWRDLTWLGRGWLAMLGLGPAWFGPAWLGPARVGPDWVGPGLVWPRLAWPISD